MDTINLKILVLGSSGSGVKHLIEDFFPSHINDPTIEETHLRDIELDGRTYKLEIVDSTSLGAAQFTAMRDLYLKESQGVMVVYSVIAQSTFYDLSDLVQQVFAVKDTREVPMVLVGSKCDLEDQRVITTEQGQKLAQEFGCPFFEASAKTHAHIREAFFCLIRQIPIDTVKPKRQANCCFM
eukprot:TRINITY_DN2237_c0_g1_i3.p1 TRINITY_DN2237_c0_g1~~TRINITY_DN2237_c0_g1_i3.p1  ORF type:complete len:182 (+),score=2.03 TRINITY_DN2237_c0_g1_i3:47-592(+)